MVTYSSGLRGRSAKALFIGSNPIVTSKSIIMKTNFYKKLTTKECVWCDYYGAKCRKNKKCAYYKKLIKTSMKNRKKQNKLLYSMEYE